MRTLYTIICAVLIVQLGSAQGEYNIWTFGNGAGLDFNTEIPTSFSSSLYSIESCGAICDADGNLLFYTNGGAYPFVNVDEGGVWNANHELMPGSDLSNSLLSQSAFLGPMILKDPGNPNEYYIFHTDSFENGFVGGLRYHKVDMTMEDGLGDVVEQDVLVAEAINEGILCVRDPYTQGYWIVVKEANSNTMLAFLLTASGIADPVVNTIESSETGMYIMNHTGDRILVMAEGDAFFYSFDIFNGTMNLLSQFTSPRLYRVFSPNGQFLYSTGYDLDTQSHIVIQSDISNIASGVTEEVVGYLPTMSTPMQLGPDGVIYLSQSQSNTMSAILNPDQAGENCNFAVDYIDLGSSTCSFGLPVYPHIPHENPTDIASHRPSFRVYPNPVVDYCFIESADVYDQIDVVDRVGRMVGTYPLAAGKTDLSDLDPGVYFIKLNSSKDSGYFKIAKN